MVNETDFNEMKIIGDYLSSVPYNVSRKTLYDATELYQGFDFKHDDTFSQCYDSKVYQHYLHKGKRTAEAQEALARALHDHHIGVALNKFLAEYEKHRIVGIMGGHALLRTDRMFREIVFISKQLTEMGYLMISGGGPGAMEATHLGAWLAGKKEEDVETALQILAIAPSFKDNHWLSSAFLTKEKFPQTVYESLGIPTWLYGHEPATPFATHIAKLFENSIREDSLLTYAYGGIIYTPGSAGTIQEIFQEAVQNHYLSFGFSSPMIFMGTQYWTEELPIYPLLQHLVNKGKYKNLNLKVSDDSTDIITYLKQQNI